MSDEILVVACGLVPYEEAEVAQRWLREARQDGTSLPTCCCCSSIRPIYTRGRRSDPG